ncbi:hypothetical protein [Sulfurospirillum barnesii]|uniref:Pilus assembly protein, PilO n=1 Tax=Sulfurospirillum barnesii (strain ATCC 700032 / DSM 10660 / SES-3) TaxID=760154 RepID=I3XX50_SULBS|nr:hypothetical protein [Sulfurospirillum barnesii]AFL68524.1 hypothetical protein Sulba_1230 [Sulfurospirillum barnesii SES-3]
MNNRIDTLLNKIDRYFGDKKESEVYLIFLMIFASIAFFTYSYVSPITQDLLKRTQRNAQEIERKLRDEQAYLASVSKEGDSNYFIKKVTLEIEDAKILFEKTQDTNLYIDTKLRDLSYLLFNNENWAKFIDSITFLAQKYSVKIKLLENKMNEPNLQKIEQILSLKLTFNGSFANTMKFMNAIEESELVVDIHDLTWLGKEELEGEFNIAIWGMKY